MKLKVMTYNICSGRDFTVFTPENPNYAEMVIDATHAARTMAKYAPDIIGVNEVRGKGKTPDFQDEARAMGEYLGYHYFFGPAINFETAPTETRSSPVSPFSKPRSSRSPPQRSRTRTNTMRRATLSRQSSTFRAV